MLAISRVCGVSGCEPAANNYVNTKLNLQITAVKSTSALTAPAKVPLATKIVLKTSKTSTTKPKIQTTTVSPTAVRRFVAVSK